MPRNNKKFYPLQVHIPAGSQKEIAAAAEATGKSVSDFVREAIEKHMATNNHPVRLDVPSRGPRKAS